MEVLEKSYDVIVMGGGPAGSTAAAILAMHGRKVAVVEKEKFPRYHIGESMMPYCWFTLERLGLVERITNSHFPKKYSVQFVTTNGKMSQPFYFFQHYDHPSSTTWQVNRAEFDTILLDNAREKGAEVFEETKAVELVKDNGSVVGVNAERNNGEKISFRAPMTIDCTGRDALTVARQGWRQMDPMLKKIAIWTYFKNAKRDPGLDEGATTVAYVPQKGWFWFIPLPDNMTSVGIVAEKDYLFDEGRDFEKIFEREIKKNVWITEHLDGAERVADFQATGEFSYRSKHCAADGIVLAGDAFAFLDPVFSSGLFLALLSGEKVADAVHRALDRGDYSASQFEDYGSNLCSGIEAMRKLVYAFYDENFSFRELIMKHPEVRPDLTDCLIGNLMRDFDALFKGVADFANVPEELSHGKPLVAVAV